MANAMRGIIRAMQGIYWDNVQENGNYYIVYWGYIGELRRGYIGIMDKKMETTTTYIGVVLVSYVGDILGI